MNSLFSYIDRNEYRKGSSIPRWGRYNVHTGPDGNTYNHQLVTHRVIIKKYAKLDGYSREDFIALRVTALVHDLGEYTEGDTTVDEKVEELELRETNAWHNVARRVARGNEQIFAGMLQGLKIEKDGQHRLFSKFKLYERLGYIYGAIIASELNTANDIGLHWLCHNVLANQYEHVLNASKDHKSAGQFLYDFDSEIRDLFLIGSEHKNSPEKEEAFQRAKKLYESRTN